MILSGRMLLKSYCRRTGPFSRPNTGQFGEYGWSGVMRKRIIEVMPYR